MRCRTLLIPVAMILVTMLLGSILAGAVHAEAVLVGHWDLDEGSGDTAADSATPPASDGTLGGGASWAAGYSGGGVAFDGNGDRVDMGLGGSDELAITGDLTMDFWLKPTGTGSNKYGPLVGINMSGGAKNDAYFTDIVYTASVNGDPVGEDLPKGTIEFGITEWDGVNDPVNVMLRSDTALSTADDNTTWYHVRCEYDAGDRMAIYIDGELDAELTSGVPAEVAYANYEDKPAPQFALGALGAGSSSSSGSYCFKGVLDEVRVYTGVVPEPTCFVLLVTGLVGLLARRRRDA